VVLPRSLLEGGDGQALRWVMLHEGAHLARHDQRLMAALQIACILAWPIVPLWIAAARIRGLIELAADERALAGARVDERRRYGEVLLTLAEQEEPPSLALVPSFGGGLRGRLTALAFLRRWPLGLQLALVGAAAAAVLACSGQPTAPGADKGSDSAPAHPAAGQSIKPRPADTIPGRAIVEGNLDQDIVRRVVRRHINEVKFCYDKQLQGNPTLGGRWVVGFTIDATGTVKDSKIVSSTVSNPEIDRCLSIAVRRWQFPRPEGGEVTVSYPFVLTPDGR
jgi:TonB family protein